MMLRCYFFIFFFFNDTATTEIYTLSLHDALPISDGIDGHAAAARAAPGRLAAARHCGIWHFNVSSCEKQQRSEEHTSELQSRLHLVCRLLLEKKKDLQQTLTVLDPLPYSQAFRSH